MRSTVSLSLLWLLLLAGSSLPASAASSSVPSDDSLAAPVMPTLPAAPEWPPAPDFAAAAEHEVVTAALGRDYIPAAVALPALPRELLLPDVPRPAAARPRQGVAPAAVAEDLKLAPEPLARTPKPPLLLPAPDQDPGVVYVVPFIALMVPLDVQERIFDQFVDTLNQRQTQVKFVILKRGLRGVDSSWLEARRYVTGEIFGYVEESGCCSTEMRTHVRLSYFRAHQVEPALKYEYPTRTFFEHDHSTLVAERQKFADRITEVLVNELMKAMQS